VGNFQVAAVDFGGRGAKKIIRNVQVQMDPRKLTIPMEVIAGEAYDLSLQNVSGGNFEWQFSDGRRRTGVSAKGKKFPSPGTHDIKLIDRSGKYPPLVKRIVVKPDNRSLVAEPKIALPSENMKFRAVNFRGRVKWDFGDGTVVDGQRVMNHKYKTIGKYKVQAVDFGGKSQKPFTEDVSVVELTPDFDITTIELAFTDGKYYKVVPKKSQAPRYHLKLKVRGRGLIRGEWLLDGMSLGNFSVFALENQIINLKGTRVARLPMQDLGIHNFTFSFQNYDFKNSLPTIRYFIALGGAIGIRSPLSGAKVAAKESTKLRWVLRKKAAKFEVAVSATPFQFLNDAQITWQSVGAVREFMLDLTSYKPGDWVYWQVREVDSSGKVLTTSEIASFKIVPAQ
jgi:PKD repeat protein